MLLAHETCHQQKPDRRSLDFGDVDKPESKRASNVLQTVREVVHEETQVWKKIGLKIKSVNFK